MSDDSSFEPATDHLVIGGPDAPTSRKRWWIGGAALGVLAIGGGAATWAVASFLSQGSQPAEALPDSTVGYVSIDLDPSGSQKIAALKLARKFPAFKDQVGLESDDDVRRWLFDKVVEGTPCDLDFDKDVEPWLGSRAAVAAVGAEEPAPVVVVQAADAAKAKDGVRKLVSCDGTETGEPGFGWAFDGDWIVFAETTEQAEQVVKETENGSLADDPDFQEWTDKAGDSGIMTAYAAPTAGQVIARELGGESEDDGMSSSIDPFGMLGACPGLEDRSSSGEKAQARLADFGGAAATLRFDGDGLALEMAGDLSTVGGAAAGPKGTPVITSLPADTAVAFGLASSKDWVDQVLKGVEDACGEDADPDALFGSLSGLTGLDLPDDLRKLMGDSLALALGSGIDVEGLVNGNDPSDLPLALKVRGDTDDISGVAAKLRERLGAPAGVLEPVSGDGVVAFGLDKEYAGQVAEAGKLGSSDVFTGVVPEADRATGALFVSFDALDDAIESFAGGDDEVTDNLAPLKALGLSAWTDGEDAHGLLKVSVR